MREERFRELWAQVEHIGNIEHLSDDALLALGSVFGELKSKINEQAERVEELENENRILRTVAESNKYIGEQYLEQNKRYREAIQKARDELNRQSGAVNDLGQVNINKDLLQVFLILSKALEGEE